MESYKLPDDPCFTELKYQPGNPTTPPFHWHLPPELSPQIFRQLPPADLRSATLVCSSFRYLAQPFLFTILDVSPFFLAAYNGDETVTRRPCKYLDRTVSRIQFYRSNKGIARAVRQCWVSPYARQGFPPRNQKDYLEPQLVIDAVLKALPFFPNLSRLTWHCIDISVEWWDIIRRLPIHDLWLNSCSVQGSNLPPLHIKELDVDHWAWEGATTNHVSVHEKYTQGVSLDILQLVLHPEHIERISVPRINTSNRLLTVLKGMHTETTRLRALCIPFLALRSPDFLPALEMCPTLQELSLLRFADEHASEIDLGPLPLSLIPHLSKFEGPSTHLLNFGRGRPLRHVKLWGMDERPYVCDPDRLLDILHHFSEINDTIESLHVFISRVTSELLAIVTSFPKIQTVTMEAVDNPPLMTETEAGLRISTAHNHITVRLLQPRYVHPQLTCL
jgi:hypothetical protein